MLVVEESLGLGASLLAFLVLRLWFICSSSSSCGLVPLFARDAARMIRSKDLIEIRVRKGVVRKEFLVMPVVLGRVDA